MKRLTLLRHAKSGWDDPALRDFDRPLNDRGERAARVVGRHLRELDLRFDRAVASPAVRVRETIAQVEASLGRSLRAEPDRRLYLASAQQLLDVVRETDDVVGSLLLVAHNPGLEELAMLLTPDNPLRREIALKYPTATVAEIELEAERWADAEEGGGTLARFIRPRDLDPELGPED